MLNFRVAREMIAAKLEIRKRLLEQLDACETADDLKAWLRDRVISGDIPHLDD